MRGYTVTELDQLAHELRARGMVVETRDLSGPDLPEATVLVIRSGVTRISGVTPESILAELTSMPKDTKAMMRGTVKNKKARHNNVIADVSQEPDYAKGKGTIVRFADYPELDKLRKCIVEILKPPTENLVAELNHYFDVEKCGIGWHGDAERRLVIGARFGAGSKDMPLKFQWFQNWNPIGEEMSILLNHGDVYIMCQKSVGTDWKSNVKGKTLRHASGSKLYTKPKLPKRKR